MCNSRVRGEGRWRRIVGGILSSSRHRGTMDKEKPLRERDQQDGAWRRSSQDIRRMAGEEVQQPIEGSGSVTAQAVKVLGGDGGFVDGRKCVVVEVALVETRTVRASGARINVAAFEADEVVGGILGCAEEAPILLTVDIATGATILHSVNDFSEHDVDLTRHVD